MNFVTPKAFLVPHKPYSLPTEPMSWPERVEALAASNKQLQDVIERQDAIIAAMNAENGRLHILLLRRSWPRRVIAGLKRAIG